MRKIIIMMFLCLAGAILNIVINQLNLYAGIPLYLDTILTITITLTCGLFWGTACGALTNIIGHSFIGGGWEGYLFVICNIATAFVTWFFMRIFPQELNLSAGSPAVKGAGNSISNKQHHNNIYKSSLLSMIMDRVIVLIIFSSALCFAMSFLGGLIAAVILTLNSSVSGESRFAALFSATMFKGNTHVLIAEIVSRIPVNTIERLISAFSGYGIALALRLLLNICLKPCI